ncbi:MAG: murein biosynthesis integral membrane protein MurJ, partial [Rhodospirillales bacterium]|nr:murein biosynthesis integral membrane protein MurJ [Rhodospirillales bacterium]
PMNLLKAITTVGGYTLLSRVFGFIRDILIANFLGAGAAADAFFVAFRFPNLFRRLFAEGAFAAAFVPIFSRSLEKESCKEALEFANQAFTVLAILLFVFVALMEAIMPWAMIFLAPGFEGVEGKMEMATVYSRIAFPYLVFISLVSLQSGVLNSVHRFAAAAAAPVLLNLTFISAMLVFPGDSAHTGLVLSWAVSVAGVVQFIWLAYHCRREGYPVCFARPRLSPKVRILGQRILPVVFGTSLYQINLLIGTILASLVADGAVSYLYYADRVTQLPLGVVGVAVGTALLPTLSRQLAAQQNDAAMSSQNRGLEFALLISLPAMAALIVMPEPIIRVLFERGAFGVQAVSATSQALVAYSVGLPAYVLIKVLTPGFFAREDTKTPVRIAIFAMLANIIMNLIFMRYWGHVGIAYASSISAWANALALGIILNRRGELVLDGRLLRRAPRVVMASVCMGGALYYAVHMYSDVLFGGSIAQWGGMVVLVVGGALLFAVLAVLFGAVKLIDTKRLLKR